MPNIKSAIKQMKKSQKAKMRNKSCKSAMRTQIKKFLTALETNNVEQAKAEFPATMAVLDRMAHKHLLHQNNANRQKAKLHIKYNALLNQKPAQPQEKKEE